MEEESVLMRDGSGKYNGSIVANHQLFNAAFDHEADEARELKATHQQ